MFGPLKITSEYTLLKSTIRINELITFLKEHNITYAALVDENLYGTMDFYESMLKNSLKPIIGLTIALNNCELYLYAKNYQGYKNLLKIHTLKEFKKLEENLHTKLPLGASSEVDKKGCEIAKTYGLEKLEEIAKISFKNTERIKDMLKD